MAKSACVDVSTFAKRRSGSRRESMDSNQRFGTKGKKSVEGKWLEAAEVDSTKE
jgi:hypothetical protein